MDSPRSHLRSARFQKRFALLSSLILLPGLAQAQSLEEPAEPAPVEQTDGGVFSPEASSPAVAQPPESPLHTDAAQAGAQAPSTSSETETVPAPVEAAPEEKDRQLGTLVVGSKESRTPGSVHLLNAKTLERFERDDANAILQTVPGVYARGEDGLGLRPNIGIRGANPNRSSKITLLEDGVLFGPAPYSAPAAYYFPMMTRMEGVRVLKGPSALVAGPQTVGGTVDLLTQQVPRAQHAGLDLAGGQYGYNKVHGFVGASTDRLGFLLEGLHLGTSGFKELDGGGSTGFSKNELMGKLRYLLDAEGSATQEIQLKASYQDEDSNETYLGLTDQDLRANPRRRYLASQSDRMQNHRISLVLSHLLKSDHFRLTTNVYRHDFDRTWRKVNGVRGADISDVLAHPEDPTNQIYLGIIRGTVDSEGPDQAILIGPNHRTFVSQGIQSVAQATFTTGAVTHNMEAGARLHYDRIVRVHTQDGFLMEQQNLVADGLPTETTVDNQAHTYAVALHALDVATYGRLAITAGMRTEFIRSTLVDHLSQTTGHGSNVALLPGAGLYLALAEGFGALAGAYRGFSPAAPGQPGMQPEYSWNYEGGLRFQRKRTRLEAIGFFNDYSNLTDICTLSSGCEEAQLDTQYNAGRVNIWGAEVYLEHLVTTRVGLNFPLSLAYTFTQSRFRSSFSSGDPQFGNVQEGDELPYVPQHQLYASAGAEWWKLSAFASFTVVGRMREVAGQGAYVPGQTTDPQYLLDLSAAYQVFSFAKVYAQFRNVLDGQYIVSRRPFGARPNAPEWLQVGLKFTY